MSKQLPPMPLPFPPGFLLEEAPLAGSNRYVGGVGIRFRRGKPEKRLGYINLTTQALIGIARGAWTWNDLTARQLIGTGTAFKAYLISNQDFSVDDITPWVSTVTESNPISTTNGSNVVTVTIPGHDAVQGQYIDIPTVATVGGLNMQGSWPINTVIDANNVTVLAPTNANATAGPGGGAGIVIGIEILPGTVNPQAAFGWGAGPWGSGTWGTPRQTSNLIFFPRTWAVQNFGKIGLYSPYLGGIYSIDPTAAVGTRLAIVATAPTQNNFILSTSDDIVIAFGANFGGTQDPLSWWCSAQGDFTNWDVTAIAGPSGAPSAQARVNIGNKFVAGADLGVHVSLAWTDMGLYAFQYVGNQLVFDVQNVGQNCGLIGPLAFCIIGTEAYWFGNNSFWTFNGGVSRLPQQEDILEAFLDDLREFYSIQMICWYDEQYDEVLFGYCDQNNIENNSLVVYNRTGQFWYTDNFITRRTTTTQLTGQQIEPLFFGDDGLLYQDNQGLDANGIDKPWSLVFGTVEIANGGSSVEIDGVVLDMQRQVGTVTATITATDRTPAEPIIIDNQISTADPTEALIDFRIAGRQAQLTLSGDGLGCYFRLAIPKLLTSQAGARR